MEEFEIPNALMDDVAEFAALHGITDNEAMALLLSDGLRRADKASVHIPVELFYQLSGCAYRLAQVAPSESEKYSAENTFTWAIEYHPPYTWSSRHESH